MYVYYNPNPVGRTTAIDCSVRALSKVLHISWDDAYDQLSEAAKQMGDMPSNNAVFAAVMRKNGFFKENLPNFCPDCYGVSDFARNNPIGTYVLGTGSHMVAVISGDEIPLFFWTR